jgi:hypothetical protein
MAFWREFQLFAGMYIEKANFWGGDEHGVPLVSLVIPAMNEAEAIGECIHRARKPSRNGDRWRDHHLRQLN